MGVALIMALSLTACFAPNSVEDYYTQREIQESVDAQMETMKNDYIGIFSDLGYTVEDNTFTYWFKFAEQVEDTETAAAELEASAPEDMLVEIVSNVEKECGITGITGSYIYYNADGTVILEKSYTSPQE